MRPMRHPVANHEQKSTGPARTVGAGFVDRNALGGDPLVGALRSLVSADLFTLLPLLFAYGDTIPGEHRMPRSGRADLLRQLVQEPRQR